MVWRDDGVVQDSENESTLSLSDDGPLRSPHTSHEEDSEAFTGLQVGSTLGLERAIDASGTNSFHGEALESSARGHSTEEVISDVENGLQPDQQSDSDSLDELQRGTTSFRHGHDASISRSSSLSFHSELESNKQEPDIFEVPPSPNLQQDASASPSSRNRNGNGSPSRSPFHSSVIIDHTKRVESVTPSNAGPPNLAETHKEVAERRFRARKAIQVHPYAEELELYRRTLKARGVQPVKIAAELARRTARGSETQDFEPQESVHLSEAAARSQPSIYTPSSSPAERHVSAEDGLDDFPDIDAIVRDPIQGQKLQGFKRRKLQATVRDHLAESDIEPANSQRNGKNQRDHEDSSFSGTHSTPSNEPKRQYRKKFKFPHGYAPPPLPTPAPSSEPNTRLQAAHFSPTSVPDQHRLQNLRELSSSPVRPTGRHSRPIPIPISSSSESSSESEPSRGDEVRQGQRRIRGVLPASWLRLDKQICSNLERTANPAKTMNTLPALPSSRKGVAKRVDRNHHAGDNTVASRRPSLDVFDLSDHSAPSSDGRISRSNSLDLHHHLIPDDSQDVYQVESNAFADILEDDWVDPMLPRSDRHTAKRGVKRKRQIKLTDFHRSKKMTADSVKTNARRRDINSSKTKQHRKQWVRRKIIPRLSILDRRGSPESSSKPNFIGVAERQARYRKNLGRHSPGKKAISMHTMQDGIEVDNVLNDWRSGRIPSRTLQYATVETTSRTEGRLPLSERSHNEQADLRSPARVPESRCAIPHLSMGRSFISIKPPTRLKLRQSLLDAQRTSPRSLQETNVQSLADELSKPLEYRNPQGRQISFLDRQGQLEALENVDDTRNSDSAFLKRLRDMERPPENAMLHFARPKGDVMARFLADGRSPLTESRVSGHAKNPRAVTFGSASGGHHRSALRQRKRPPRRVDVDQIEVHQATDSRQAPDLAMINIPVGSNASDVVAVQGLAPFGTRYSTDFGVCPLPRGVYFRQETFVGSGELQDALLMHLRDFESLAGHIKFSFLNEDIEFGQWTEETSAQLEKVLTTIPELIGLDAGQNEREAQRDTFQAEKALRKIVQYFSNNLSFLDAVDCPLFVSKSLSVMSHVFPLITNACQLVARKASSREDMVQSSLRSLMLLLVLSAQLLQLSHNRLVDETSQKKTEFLCREILQRLVHAALGLALPQFTAFLDPANVKYAGEVGIRRQDYGIEAIVVALHVSRRFRFSDFDFGMAISQGLAKGLPSQCNDVQTVENVWHDLFVTQPFLVFDQQGLLQPSLRFHDFTDTVGRWQIVKDLVTWTFEVYSRTSNVSTINSYVRVTLCRCYRLICTWRWRKSEQILGCIFDFFARRGLSLLSNEESNGSASFLENIDHEHIPQLQLSDRSFEVFLKTLAAGLILMREVYPQRKIKNILWRFVPNHGRPYRKDEALRREELDALRNHHDLLCVLYYAAPPSLRSNLLVVRRIVDVKSSHAELCHLHVRAWTNLARFQVSVDEGSSALDGLISWINDIFAALIDLHVLARTEAEAIFAQANHSLSREMLETTVIGNQRQIEGILCHVLHSMREVLARATNLPAAARLFENSTIAMFIERLDLKQKSLNFVFAAVLDAYVRYFSIIRKQHSNNRVVSQSSEDSQDYGEFPLADDDEAPPSAPSAAEHMVDHIQHSVFTALEAVNPFDEHLLIKLVETWVTAASLTVETRRRDWSNYIDPHGPSSWFKLSDISQTRQLTPLCLSLILEQDTSSFEDNIAPFLTGWLTSLVERESVLKHQHLLTAALLNKCEDHPLLQNLPFTRKLSGGTYTIALSDLRQRRLGLISTIFANMRANFEQAFLASTSADSTSTLRQEYASILRQTMAAMKRDFLETQTASSARGTYVDFVQAVVQFLQQYTADICPVDRFFTESAAFPLPAHDPMYVIGRIKSYAVRAADARTQKKLAMFVQTVCERAAHEGQQNYLRGQLEKSVQGRVEEGAGVSAGPSLRKLLLAAVFPAYIEASLALENAHLLASPVLEAAASIVGGILFSIDLNSDVCLRDALGYITPLLAAAADALQAALAHDTVLRRASSVAALRQAFSIAASAFSLVDYAARKLESPEGPESAAEAAVVLLLRLVKLARQLTGILRDDSDVESFDNPPEPGPRASPQQAFAETRAFASRELQSTMRRNWVVQIWPDDGAGTVRVLRPGGGVDVAVDVATVQEERERLLGVLDGIEDAAGALPSFRGGLDVRTREGVDGE